MKILIVNQYYPPLRNAPARRLSNLAHYLVSRGWEVSVLTGIPNYPDGKVKGVYNMIYNFSVEKGVKIYRVFEIPLCNEGFTKRMINYLSFAFSCLFSLPLISSHDVVFISTPPIFSVFSCFLYAKLLRKKVLLDVRDFWPTAVNVFFSNRLINFIFLFLNHIMTVFYSCSTGLTTTSKLMGEHLVKLTNGKTKVFVLYNIKEMSKELADFTGDDRKINIAFTGIITTAQNLAPYLLSNKDAYVERNYVWHIVGDGEQRKHLVELVRKHNIRNVHFYGYRDKAFCRNILLKSNLGLVSLKETKLLQDVMPSKTFDYLTYGLPILANGSLEVSGLIHEYEIGFFIDNLTVPSVIETLKHITKSILRDKSGNVIALMKNSFDREQQLASFELFLKEL